MDFPSSIFKPGMISTPDPRFRIPPYTGSPRGLQSMFQHPYHPTMTPITSAQTLGWDQSNMFRQNIHYPYGNPAPYNMGTSRFFPVAQTTTTSVTQEPIPTGTVTTKSVTFTDPVPSWESQINNIYENPLPNQSQNMGSRLKDGSTQTFFPQNNPSLNQNIKTEHVSQTNQGTGNTAMDLMFGQPSISQAEIKTATNKEVQTLYCHTCKKEDIEPPTFNGKDKWDTFISLFEKVAEFNDWDNSTKCKRLMIALRGSALEFVDTLQLKVTKDYDSLKLSLTQRFGVATNESLYRIKFQGRRRGENETLDKFIQDLQYLAERAYPNERGSIYHKLIVEQFIEGIGNKDCKNYLQLNLNMCKETDSSLIQEVLKYAHNYEAVMGTSERIRKPNPGLSSANTVQQEEENRNKGNHWNPNVGWRGPSKIICYKCREEGHIASRCPQNEQRNIQENERRLH